MADIAPVPVVPVELIPVSHLALDLPEPAEGWAVFLGSRGISFRSDSIGRDAVTVGDARRLLDERRADELRKQRHLALVEQEVIEADRLWRAQIWRGVPADALPVGVSASSAILQAAKDAQPRRRSMIEESFAGQSMTYHSLADDAS
jgi:hypothetical protein